MQTPKLHPLMLAALSATLVAVSAMDYDGYEIQARHEVLLENLERRGSITEALNSTWQNSANCPTGNVGCGKGCIGTSSICCNNDLGTYCLPKEICIPYKGPSIALGWACWYSSKGEPAPTNAGAAETTLTFATALPTGTTGTTGLGGSSGSGGATSCGTEGVLGVVFSAGAIALVSLVL